MKYIECPANFEGEEKSIFLAGGISNCSDWQKEMVELLKNSDLTLLNPRREKFDVKEKDIEEEQITWEYNHLEKADAVSFWFTSETLCPMTLFELGKQLKENKPIFLGINPEYIRKSDVEIQTKLARSNVKIVYSLKDLAEQIKRWEKLNES